MWNFIVISYKSGGDFFWSKRKITEQMRYDVMQRDHTYTRVDQRPYLYPCWSMIDDLYKLLTPLYQLLWKFANHHFYFCSWHLLTPLWFLHVKGATWNWRYMYLCVPWYYGKQVRCFRGMIWLSYLFHRIRRSPCP